MSTNGLEVFDKTIQTAHVWLNEIIDRLGCDRSVAWRVLGSVLRAVRDCLRADVSAHLGSQLPLIVRGLFYDQFSPERQPGGCGTPQEFNEIVAHALGNIEAVDPGEAILVVFSVLERHISDGQLAKIRHALPRGARMAWDGADAR